jgi:hypothetical protein
MEFSAVWLRTELDRLTRAAQQLALLLQPYGGQGRARRNAWRGLSEDRQRREQRIEAERSVEAALVTQRSVRQQTLQQLTPEQYSPEQHSPERRPSVVAV